MTLINLRYIALLVSLLLSSAVCFAASSTSDAVQQNQAKRADVVRRATRTGIRRQVQASPIPCSPSTYNLGAVVQLYGNGVRLNTPYDGAGYSLQSTSGNNVFKVVNGQLAVTANTAFLLGYYTAPGSGNTLADGPYARFYNRADIPGAVNFNCAFDTTGLLVCVTPSPGEAVEFCKDSGGNQIYVTQSANGGCSRFNRATFTRIDIYAQCP